jgi:hypothetical protein
MVARQADWLEVVRLEFGECPEWVIHVVLGVLADVGFAP